MTDEAKVLKEVIDKVMEVFSNSAYMQHILYDANAGKQNWYSKAKEIINKQSKN